MNAHLVAWARSRGYQVAWGPASLIEQARRDVEGRLAAGEIDRELAAATFPFEYPPVLPDRDTVVMVAVPRPAYRVTFVLGDGPFDAIMPPTYVRYRPTFEDVRRELAEHALPGYRVSILAAPLKSLAVRLGLVRYGRNNLVYAPGLGTYLQLLGYVTDAPLSIDDAWAPSEPRLLDRCANCHACERQCPTGAITAERTLLHAERCLTHANEAAGEWPRWVADSMHHTLIGCLVCQRQCPANPPLPVEDTGVVFGRDETRALLSEGDHDAEAWNAIRTHLEELGRAYQEPVLGRNLRALLRASRHHVVMKDGRPA